MLLVNLVPRADFPDWEKKNPWERDWWRHKAREKERRTNRNFFFIGRQGVKIYLADHNTERYKVQNKEIKKNDIIK